MRKLATLAALLALSASCGSDNGSGPGVDADPNAPDADPNAPDADPNAPDADPAAPDAATDPVTDTGVLGDFAVHEQTGTAATSLGNAQVTVYSPSTDGGATPAAGPFPLVVVSTGFSIGRANYDKTCEHLASWGYVVLSHDYTSGNHDEKAAEIGDLIDWATGGSSGIASRVDATKIAAAGHSLGGKVSIFAAILDSRIKTVVGWDPVDALPPFGNDGSSSVSPERIDELTVPLAVIGETTDAGGGFGMACAPADDNYTQFFDFACASPDTLEVTVANADHTDWVDSRQSCGFACLACQTGSTPDATVLQITRRMTVAWLERHLRGNVGAMQWYMAPGLGTPTTTRTTPADCP